MRIQYLGSKDEAVKAAAGALASLLQQPGPILLLLAGGSSFSLFNHIKADLLSNRVTIGMIDERYDADSVINNFVQLSATPFAQVAARRGVQFIDSRVQTGETLEQFARRLEAAWKTWTQQFPTGNILATLGMGPDGHTAGIMAYPENKSLFKRLFDDVQQWMIGYNAEGKHEYRYRATATLPFLRTEVDAAVAFVAGPKKRAALQRVLAGTGSLAETPARIWQEMRNMQIFTDIQNR